MYTHISLTGNKYGLVKDEFYIHLEPLFDLLPSNDLIDNYVVKIAKEPVHRGTIGYTVHLAKTEAGS